MTQSVTAILDDLDDLAEAESTVSVSDVLEKIGERSTGALLLIPALVAMSPLGMIPTLPTLFGLIIAITSVQIIIGRDTFWMPQAIRARSVRDKRLQEAIHASRGPANHIDRWTGSRLQILTRPPAPRIAALLSLLLALCLPPLELVPGAAFIPLAGIFLFGLALTLRDGIVMLVAFAGSAAALWGAWRVMPF